MEYHLGNAVILIDKDILASHIAQAEGQLPAEPGIHETATEEDTASPE
jgi:hypothetical protein